MWSDNQRGAWFSKCELLTLNPHPIRFGCRSCGSRDIMFESVIWPYKQIIFMKFVHRHHSLKIAFENGAKVKEAYFNIPVAINSAEIINHYLRN